MDNAPNATHAHGMSIGTIIGYPLEVSRGALPILATRIAWNWSKGSSANRHGRRVVSRLALPERTEQATFKHIGMGSASNPPKSQNVADVVGKQQLIVSVAAVNNLLSNLWISYCNYMISTVAAMKAIWICYQISMLPFFYDESWSQHMLSGVQACDCGSHDSYVCLVASCTKTS